MTNGASSRLPATAALLALGVSVAVAGYVWVEQRSGIAPRLTELRGDLDAKDSELAALKARLDEVAAGRRLLNDDLDRLRDRVTRETEALGELPGRVDQVEDTLQRFVGVGDKVRAAWLLAEAEHYMRIANAQLGLAGDVGVAETALGLADDSLRELNDPRLLPVRKELAAEINALKAVPRPDTEGIVLSLGSLADSLDSLRLKSSAPSEFRTAPEKPAAPLTGLDRALAATRSALASLISVRRVDDPVSPLLTEAEQAVLVRSLDLELQLARLAIMRGDAGMYRRSIEAASDRLQQHFDLASPDVQAAAESLAELGTAKLPEELPDISGSLDALLRISAAGRPGAVARQGSP
ncbi:MAG: uroporphyrinogen-III C-methyltransferase [Gammaproteobacteria bacterium]|nr:uroporphyrinogen-III C-methyltransferase [Gammaproteobacteria bacterium]